MALIDIDYKFWVQWLCDGQCIVQENHMKKELGIFATLVAGGFLTACAATGPDQQGGSESEAMRESPKKASENAYRPAASEQGGEVARDLEEGERHYQTKFADWTATKIIEPDRARPQVLVCSAFSQEDNNSQNSQFCFRFYSQQFVVVEPQGVREKGYWPHCEYDRISYRVDDSEPAMIPTIKGGLCSDDLDTAKEQFIQELKRGKTLYAQLLSSRGQVPLNGFASAWDYASDQF